jgi:hypothetical protein
MGIVVGLSGLAGAGKDTVADLLVNDFGFVKVAFADPIKRAAMDWWDFSEDQLWGASEMRNKPDLRYPTGLKEDLRPSFVPHYNTTPHTSMTYLTPRYVLQKIGTDIARSLDKDVWLRYGMKVARQLLQHPDKLNYKQTVGVVEEKRSAPIAGVVISDGRFTNELVHIGENGGKLIRIKRPGAGLSGEAAKHASETEHQEWPDDCFDYVLNNDGTMSDLHDRVGEMVSCLLGSQATPVPKQLKLF